MRNGSGAGNLQCIIDAIMALQRAVWSGCRVVGHSTAEPRRLVPVALQHPCRLPPPLSFWTKEILCTDVFPCCFVLLLCFYLPVKSCLAALQLALLACAQAGWGHWDWAGTGLLPAQAFLCHPRDQLPKPPQPRPGHILPAEDTQNLLGNTGKNQNTLPQPWARSPRQRSWADEEPFQRQQEKPSRVFRTLIKPCPFYLSE